MEQGLDVVTNTDADLVRAFAPTGRLRASINLGNAVLARRAATGEVEGISVTLARAFARRLGVEMEPVVVDGAAKAVAAVAQGQADIGFFAIDPARGEAVAFTPAYLLIEGAYLVRDNSPLRHIEEVDQVGHRIVVKQGSAYDLFLSRSIRNATLLRVEGRDTVVQEFLGRGAEVAAGIRQSLQAQAQQNPGLRLLPARFMVIEQAMGCAKRLGVPAARALAAFVEEAKATGLVADAMQRDGEGGATVAPAALPPMAQPR